MTAAACDDEGASTDAGMDGGRDAGGPQYPDSGPVEDVAFPAIGSLASAAGEGSFRFGAATAATQIEDMNPLSDWYVWTQPTDQGGLGRGEFVGDAVRGYSQAVEDVRLVTDLGLDAYRFSVEWARVEPQRDRIDQAAVTHYRELLDALHAAGVRPMITIHHFSNPRWVDDPVRAAANTPCPTPTDEWLCGWQDDAGGPLIVEEMREHARLLAERYGDRVDEWATINEPVNYLLTAYGLGQWPPGRGYFLTDLPRFMTVVRNFLAAHVAMYQAIKQYDTVDADGDGVAADVGLTLSVADWFASRSERPSARDDDRAAAARLRAVYHFLVADALLNGQFDSDLDGTPDEAVPQWADTLDWLGVQYYFRAGVTAQPALLPPLRLTPCFGPLGTGTACVPPADPTHWVREMRYEYNEEGLYRILTEYGARYPELPLVVTEAGIATEVGRRRAENVVRTLEQIHYARRAGVDVRGYYHWSLMDNFEWAEGYRPRFGLYRVERSGTYERTPTEGATVLDAIATSRSMTIAQRQQYGGYGPMTPEAE